MKDDSLARRLFLSALAVVLGLALGEGVMSWLNAFLQASARLHARPSPEARIARHDPELGWAPVPSKRVADLYGPGRDYTANAQGIRAREAYSAQKPPGRCRVVFAGDSFTMGFGVGDADTYPAALERFEPRIQSVNLGMGAYGADQAFLRYRRDAAPLAHDVVVFAFIAHDLRRMEKRFYMAPKPQLALRGGKLVVANAPVPERDASEDRRAWLTAFLQNLDLAKALTRVVDAIVPAPSSAEAQRAAATNAAIPAAPVADAMLGELAALARQRHAQLALVYLPTRPDLVAPAQPVRDWAARAAAARGIRFLDITPALRGRPPAPLFGLAGHYSEAGNALVAEALLPTLRGLCALPEAPASPAP